MNANRRRIPSPGPWFWLASVPLAWVLVLFGYPLFDMAVGSFEPSRGSDAGPLEHYIWYFTNDVQLLILLRTFGTALLVAVVTTLIGFPYAYLMTMVSASWRAVMLGVVLLPFWSSVIVRTYAWALLLRDSGPVPVFLAMLGFPDPRLIGSLTAVTVASVQVLMPFLILPLYASLSRIDRKLLEAAKSLGATPTKAFGRIYLPLAMPGVIAGSTTVFVLMLGFFFTPAILGSPRNSLISQQIYNYVSQLELGRAAAIGMVLLVLTLTFVALAGRSAARVGLIRGRS